MIKKIMIIFLLNYSLFLLSSDQDRDDYEYFSEKYKQENKNICDQVYKFIKDAYIRKYNENLNKIYRSPDFVDGQGIVVKFIQNFRDVLWELNNCSAQSDHDQNLYENYTSTHKKELACLLFKESCLEQYLQVLHKFENMKNTLCDEQIDKKQISQQIYEIRIDIQNIKNSIDEIAKNEKERAEKKSCSIA